MDQIIMIIAGAVASALGAGYLWLKRKHLNKWLEKTDLDELLEAALSEVKLKVMESLEKAAEDGVVTADEVKEALNVGVVAFKDLARARRKEYLLAVVSDQFLRDAIFSMLGRLSPVGRLAEIMIPKL